MPDEGCSGIYSAGSGPEEPPAVNERMAAATFSISHFGVEVAPQMPTDRQPANHSARSSPSSSMLWLRGLAAIQAAKRALPLELFFAADENDGVVSG